MTFVVVIARSTATKQSHDREEQSWRRLLRLYSNQSAHQVLYTDITGDLQKRVYQHRQKLLPGFTSRYNASKLVYYEAGYDPSGAIAREKQVKHWDRQKRLALIASRNPTWKDLAEFLFPKLKPKSAEVSSQT